MNINGCTNNEDIANQFADHFSKVFYNSNDDPMAKKDKNSSGDEIANVNFFYNIAHVEASAYAH